MSYTRPCNKCGERISLRQMPQGQWVAFDVSTEESHVCGVKNDPDVSVKLKGKKKKLQKEDEDDSFGIKYEDEIEDLSIEDEEDDIEEVEVKTYDSVSGIHHCIDKAIKEKKRIHIEYNSEHNEERTEREISPIKKFKEKERTYLQAYCHKRKGERIFLTRSISTASEVNKDRTKVKIGKPSLHIIKKNQIKSSVEKILKKNEKELNRQKEKENKEWEKDVKRMDREEKKREKEETNQLPGWLLAVVALFVMAIVKAFLSD
jgi:hypothetical protein